MAAAAGGVGAVEPVVPIHKKVLYWYIRHHQVLINSMLTGMPNQVLYYGGFALNIALGCRELSARSSLLQCYNNGLQALARYTGEGEGVEIDMHASDIDAKILNVPHNDEYTTLFTMIMNAFTVKKNPFHPLPMDAEFYAAVTKATATKGSTTVMPGSSIFIRTPDDLVDSPLKYILAHIISYKKADGPHCQLILTGFVQGEGDAWNSQVLSELTPTPPSGVPPASADRFLYTPLSELRDQFQALSTYLEGRINAYSVARKQKTNIRVAASHNVFTKRSTKGGKKGGGSRRRRRSVKK